MTETWKIGNAFLARATIGESSCVASCDTWQEMTEANAIYNAERGAAANLNDGWIGEHVRFSARVAGYTGEDSCRRRA